VGARLALQWGDGAFGVPLMKFTLTYDGELPSNGKVREKWEIRKQFHPQLQELWLSHPATLAMRAKPHVARFDPFLPGQYHHSIAPQVQKSIPVPNINLCEEIQVGPRRFLPLVRERTGLRCALKILFLRKEEPGRVYQGGDLDNRLKTLFDALSVPNADQIVDDGSVENPIYCLLEDDGLITGCAIDTHRLLSRPNSSQHEVHLVVEVDVRVTHPRSYNESFLGD
jgi:hypothetical protein